MRSAGKCVGGGGQRAAGSSGQRTSSDPPAAAARRQLSSTWRTSPWTTRKSTRCCSRRRRSRLPGGIARADGDAAAAKPAHFYDLVVQVANHSPGSDRRRDGASVPERRAGREPVVPLHPCLEPILARTLGVPLSRSSCCGCDGAAGFTRAGRGAAARDGFQALRETDEADELQPARGMARNGITARRGVHHQSSRRSALRLSPIARGELRAARYASAYLQRSITRGVLHGAAQQPARWVYHPASLVKDAQAAASGLSDRRAAVDWLCRVEEDAPSGSGSCTVNGLRKRWVSDGCIRQDEGSVRRCSGEVRLGYESMIEMSATRRDADLLLQHLRARVDRGPASGRALRSIEQVVQRTGLRPTS